MEAAESLFQCLEQVADQEMYASVDGKWAKQSEDARGNPLVMVNVLAHDL